MRKIVLILSLTFSAFGNIIYVSPTGSTSGDGSESAPYDSVQRGINESVDGDTVLLEDGTYHEHNLHLFSKRIVLGSRFVLDGDTNHVDNCVIDGDNSEEDSGSIFCIINPIDSSTKFFAFKITNGGGTKLIINSIERICGGGIFFTSDSLGLYFEKIKIEFNMKFERRADYGAAVFKGNSSFTNCFINWNYNKYFGGVIYGGRNSLTNCKISKNKYGYAFENGESNFLRCDISNNERAFLNGINFFDSCDINNNSYSVFQGGLNTLLNCAISKNGCADCSYSDAIFGRDGVNYMENCSIFGNEYLDISFFSDNTLVNCSIRNNRAGFFTSNDTLNNCRLSGNSVTLFYQGGSFLRNCIVTDNNTSISRGNVKLTNCTFARNGGIGAGILTIENCIIKDKVSQSDAINKFLRVYYSLIDSFAYFQGLDTLGVILNEDPRFVDLNNDDFHLHPLSKAIDAGHPDSSFDQEPLCNGNNKRINMGFYGNTLEAACKASEGHMVFVPDSFNITVFQDEIKNDTLAIFNNTTDTVYVSDTNDIVYDNPYLNLIGMNKTNAYIALNETCYVYFEYSSDTIVTDTILIHINFFADNSGSIYKYFTRVLEKSFDSLFNNEWEFGNISSGFSQLDTFHLKNHGFNPIHIDSLREFHPNFAFTGLKDNFTVHPGDSIAIPMSFSPSETIPYSTRIYLYSPNIACIDSTLIVSGTGVDINITISPDTLKFGNVLINESKTSDPITIRNDNQVPIDITGFTFGDPAYTLSGSSGFTLDPGQQTTRSVVFSPTVTGAYNSTLTIENTSVTDPNYEIRLEGTCVAPAIGLSVSTLDFGESTVGTSFIDSVAILNTGDGTLKIDSIRADHGWFTVVGNAGYREIAPGGSSVLKIQFLPTDQSGLLNQSVSVYSNSSGSPHSVGVSGTGIKSDVSIGVSSCDFGTVELLGSRDSTVYISNSGNKSVTVDSITFSSTAFSNTSTLTVVAANSTVPLILRFAPQEPSGGDYTGKMRLYYENTYIEVTLAGKAIGRPYCSITGISPASVFWDSTVLIGFHAAADDSDDAGTGARIRNYLWYSSVAGNLDTNKNSFSVTASQLGIGNHAVSLVVVDNEGDTSDTSLGNVEIKNRLPLAEIVLISPGGLIIKGGGDVTLSGRGHDLDEYATETNDSLKSFKWYSSIQGFLGDGKTITLNSATLDIGLHDFYIQVVDDEGDTATSASKSIPVQTDIGRVLMVAGTGFDDYYYFFSKISPNCNWAYKMLQDRGFTDDHIYYMNPVGWQSLNDPYTNSNIVDNTTMTLASMRNYLLSIDVINDVKNDVPLVIYLLGHASQTQMNGKFYLNKTEVLTADTLAAWLDAYGDLTSGKSQIVVILDFCYSGQFQQRLRTALAQNRFVITSSDPTHAAYFSRGRCFAWTIWRDVHRGENLSTGYSHALDWSNLNAPGGNTANPMLNCNSDGQYNTSADYTLANSIYIGGNQQLQDVTSFVDSLTCDIDLISKSVTLTAHVREDFTKLWCRVFTPDFDYISGSIEQLPLFEMSKVDAVTYTGTFSGPWVVGRYLLKVDGTDENSKPVMGNAIVYDNDMVEIAEEDTTVIAESKLTGLVAVPNPADNNSTSIDFYLISDTYGDAFLQVFDGVGNVVYQNSCQVADYKENYMALVGNWDRKNRFAKKVAGGTYLAVLKVIYRDGETTLYKTKVGIMQK